MLVACVLLVRATVEAQTGRVSLQGAVSETVALSVPPNFAHGNVETESVSSGNTLRMTLSSPYADASTVIKVPLLVRSNSGFKISALFESETAILAQLSVTDVHATGELTSSQAINALRGMPRSSGWDTSQPLVVLSGPRISLGGTLESPNNALQITLLIRLQPQPARGLVAHLTFVGTPDSVVR
jgi:hypothetical protein